MRQKKQVMLLAFGIVLIFLISACGGGGDIASGAPSTPFIGGSSGLEIGFLADSPPAEVTDVGFPFQAIVNIKNKGEFDLTTNDVKISLIGFSPSDFGASLAQLKNRPPEDTPTARKRDSEGNIIEPIETFVSFPSDVGSFTFSGQIRGNTPFTFRAEVCYKYKTEAVSAICVLENLFDIENDAICDPSATKNVFSSSSPIGVTGLRQNVAGEDKIQFSFDIVHSGNGNIFDPTTVANCPKSSRDRRSNENKVKVEIDTGISGELSCVGVGEKGIGTWKGNVRLVNGKKTITCTQTLPTSRIDFEKNIDITVDFNYFDKVQRTILVKHLRRGGGTTTTTSTTSTTSSTGGGTGGTPSQCGGVIGGSQTYCRSTTLGPTGTCIDYGTGCGVAAADLCTCGSGFTQCAGTCADSPIGGDGSLNPDTTAPTFGTLHPTVARKTCAINSNNVFTCNGISQLYVVDNILDDQSGVKTCKLVFGSGEEFEMLRSGPIGCTDSNHPCDYWKFISRKQLDSVDIVCEDIAGNVGKNTGTITVDVKVTRTDTFVPADDSTEPKIGELVTNVARLEVNTFIMVEDIWDPESGVVSCTLIGPSSLGEPILMDLDGPSNCLGEQGNDIDGRCSARTTVRFPNDKLLSQVTGAGSIQLQYTLECINGKGIKGLQPLSIFVIPE